MYSTYLREWVALIGIGGNHPPYTYICFENNGGLRTMGKVSIVLNNGKSTMESLSIVLDNRHKEQ
jgi:hypothetical protein